MDEDPFHHYRVADEIADAWVAAWHLRKDCSLYADSKTSCIFCVRTPETLRDRQTNADAAQRVRVAYLTAMGKLT